MDEIEIEQALEDASRMRDYQSVHLSHVGTGCFETLKHKNYHSMILFKLGFVPEYCK